MKKQKEITQYLALSGILGIIFYFLHVIVGTMHYPGYDALSQAVSDLTAHTAPSKDIARGLSSAYAMMVIVAVFMVFIYFKDKVNRLFSIGLILFAVMQVFSGVGYAIFPLSDQGYAGSFSDLMHMVVTVIVVLLSIVSMVCIGLGAIRHKHRVLGIVTLVMLSLMFIGSILTGIVPKDYFGIVERISVYSVVIYSGVLSIFTFLFKTTNNSKIEEDVKNIDNIAEV